jgi:hypothetical protein
MLVLVRWQVRRFANSLIYSFIPLGGFGLGGLHLCRWTGELLFQVLCTLRLFPQVPCPQVTPPGLHLLGTAGATHTYAFHHNGDGGNCQQRRNDPSPD